MGNPIGFSATCSCSKLRSVLWTHAAEADHAGSIELAIDDHREPLMTSSALSPILTPLKVLIDFIENGRALACISDQCDGKLRRPT